MEEGTGLTNENWIWRGGGVENKGVSGRIKTIPLLSLTCFMKSARSHHIPQHTYILVYIVHTYVLTMVIQISPRTLVMWELGYSSVQNIISHRYDIFQLKISVIQWGYYEIIFQQTYSNTINCSYITEIYLLFDIIREIRRSKHVYPPSSHEYYLIWHRSPLSYEIPCIVSITYFNLKSWWTWLLVWEGGTMF